MPILAGRLVIESIEKKSVLWDQNRTVKDNPSNSFIVREQNIDRFWKYFHYLALQIDKKGFEKIDFQNF